MNGGGGRTKWLVYPRESWYSESMIAYDLECAQGHVFEGWFDNEAGFLKQCKQGLVSCPVCGSDQVVRTLSTFGISKSRGRKRSEPSPNPFEKVLKFLEENFEDVGTDFAREALKMHYGVTDYRNIRGVSSEKEEEALREEGVSFVKLPVGVTSSSDDD